MSYIDLYVEKTPYKFAGHSVPWNRARYAILGVPFDSTSSYRPGSRFAPARIREASVNVESNSLVGAELYIEQVPIYDIGDLGVVHGDAVQTLKRVEIVVGELRGDDRIPVVIGGEHIVTTGVIQGLRKSGSKPCLLVFDAHLDLRNEYLGYNYSHASTLRRILDTYKPESVVVVGARAYSREEYEYAEERDFIHILHPLQVYKAGPLNVGVTVRRLLSGCDEMYVSIDIDSIDPAYAPGTGTPEPLGLSPLDVLRILQEVVDERLVGIDVVEVNPLVDINDITSILAARLLQEALLLVEARKR